MSPTERYLNLMKKTLSFALWPEPPIPLEDLDYRRSAFKQKVVASVAGFFRKRNTLLVRPAFYSEEDRRDGKIWPGYADTMVGMKRLNNIQNCVEAALREGVEGDLIETGVWRGGSCIFMKAILTAYEDGSRKIYVADSFSGLPPPDATLYPADEGDRLYTHKVLAVSLEEVKANFAKYDLLDDKVVFLKGWFKDTLPGAPINKLAVMRLDGDLYGSTIEALENLYPKLSSGGYCIIDDYGLKTCQMAVDDFRRKYNIDEKLELVDWSGVFWRKK